MRKWFSLLSAGQRVWLVVTVLIVATVFGAVVVMNSRVEGEVSKTFTTEMPIRAIAPELGVTGKALARELGLSLDVPKNRALKELGIQDETLDHAVEHLLSHKDSSLKYYVFAAIVFGGLVFLTKLGRPDQSDIKNRRDWYPRAPYIFCLLASVIIAGFYLGKSPNPMEGVVKVFKSMVGLYPDPAAKVIAFAFFIVLVVVGNKMICGWACPFGALQELIYSLPILRRMKRKKLPFIFTNIVRAGLFLVVLLVLFGVIGGREGLVIYHYVNPFNLFNLDFESISILLTVILVLVGSFFVYRPFCQFICPFGLVAWVAERCSIYRVRIDKDKCTQCNACVKACPLEAAKGRIAGKKLPADCFSCARCLDTCPVDAIQYGSIFKKPAAQDAASVERDGAAQGVDT